MWGYEGVVVREGIVVREGVVVRLCSMRVMWGYEGVVVRLYGISVVVV